MSGINNPLNSLKKALIFSAGLLSVLPAMGKEGMWIPSTLKKHENQMKALGLEIPVEQIYNEAGTGLNNAVVLFGKGCTGEIISSKGLLLTNHHCGYGTVQGLSSLVNDYMAKGFFAKSRQEEIPCPGLTVTFIRRIENVTVKLLPGIPDTMNDADRDSILSKRIEGLEREYETKTGLDATIKPYFGGNQYWVSITETFNDIRLVGFPPDGIGKFGGDDENWMWPRHTGDFTAFRVYADADNKPAAYSADNRPYNTNQYFKINISGYKEGDFTMVYGFPGTTNEYISSYELNQVYNISDPISIEARTKKLKVWGKHMAKDRNVFIKYTAKQAGVANGWKKWQGEMLGLKMNNAPEKKKQYEEKFQIQANSDASQPHNRTLLEQLKKEANAVDSLLFQEMHIREDVLAIEMVQQGATLDKMLSCFRAQISDAALTDTLKKLSNGMSSFYKNFDMATDKDVFIALMPLYYTNCSAFLPQYYINEYATHGNNFKKWATYVYDSSMLSAHDKLKQFAAGATRADSTKLLQDPAYKLYSSVNEIRKQKISSKVEAYKTKKQYLNRLYINAQMKYNQDKDFYPDANLTLRVALGNIKGLDPDGRAKYSFQTTLKDVIKLHDKSVEWFTVPDRLRELHKQKDFGRWAVDGTVPVAFIADNHTSGGNSGSPVLNARGELIGTNFDRAYEGTMSDYLFDPNRCRNISVDVRYTLFILDKFGGAGWLIDELDLVK